MKRRLKWIGLISVLPMGTLIAFLTYMIYQESAASSTLNQKLEAKRQAGDPIDDQSMAVYFEKQTHKEGTAAWKEILELCNASGSVPFTKEIPLQGSFNYPTDLRPGSEWPEEPRVADYLKEVRPIINRIHAATDFPKPVWLPIHFDGYMTLLQPVQDVRQAIIFLDLDATHALYHNDSELALKDIIAVRSVSDAFDWPWWDITQFVSRTMQIWQWQSINRSLGMDVWNDTQLAKLTTQVDKPFDVVSLWRTKHKGDSAMFMASIDNWSKVLPNEMKDNLLYKLPVMPSTRLEVLNVHEALQLCADQGADGLAERAKATLKEYANRKSLSLGMIYISTTSLNYSAQLAQIYDERETARRLTLTSIAIKRFQLKKKRWPNNLAELSELGLVTQDWTTIKQEPFGYEVRDNLAFVWSYELQPGYGVAKTRPTIEPDTNDVTLDRFVTIR